MKTQMIGMSPKDAIGLKEVPPVNQENYPPQDILPQDGLYPEADPGFKMTDALCL